MLYIFLSPTSGIFNVIRQAMGMQAIDYMSDAGAFRSIYIISGIWQSAGYGTILYIATLTGIDQSLYEAAEIDGAGPVRQFLSITIPLISPTMFFVTTTRVIAAMQVFDVIYMMIDRTNPALPGTQSLVYLFYKYSFIESDQGYGSAIVVLLLLIIMVLTVIQNDMQKKWVNYN